MSKTIKQNSPAVVDSAEQTVRPRCWVCTTNGGDKVIHWYAETPRFVADRAAALEWPDAHRLDAMYDKATLDDAYRRGFIEGQLDMRDRA